MSEIKLKIDATMDQIEHDDSLTADHRDALLDMLLPASIATNGTLDKIGALADAVGAQSVYLARRDRRQAQDMADAIKGHVMACPMGKAPINGKLAVVFPFRWPLALVICIAMISPYVGPSMQRLADRYAGQDNAKPVVVAVQQPIQGAK